MKRSLPRWCMAKRLSKALREKRRWIGVLVHPRHQHRDAVEQVLLQISQTIEPEPSLRLMDFFPQHERPALAEQPELARQHDDGGLAIVRAPLKAMVELRNLLQDNNALETWGVMSLTTSGKIRLVRQRMGLPKPKRKQR